MRWVIVFLILILSSTTTAKASSDYVLPYPSFMPGSPFYRINLLKNEILKFWYFGNFGEFKYSLKLSDKYLVEAKTLFEYKQYLLAVNALEKSDFHFAETQEFLLKAQNENKNIEQNLLILESAKEKHIEILKKLQSEIPRTFLWEPEKGEVINLALQEEIEESIFIRSDE